MLHNRDIKRSIQLLMLLQARELGVVRPPLRMDSQVRA